MRLDLELEVLCGQLIVGGFDGAEPPARYLKALAEGRRGGAILFRRNVPDVAATARLCQALAEAGGPDRPPFIGIDQEGGRVTRLPAPFLTLPSMRSLGELADLPLLRRAARAVASELRAVGINLNFAPVLDVDSNPANPIIGDRAFGRDPGAVARGAVAFLEGLQEEGVLACGKHFPGHGDTALDSHLALPTLSHARGRLDEIELPPFRAACGAGVASLMTAHIVVEALDPGVPATLSRAICTDLLRGEIGFEGVLFSDDLEMAAIAAHNAVEEAAAAAVWAGCDALLVCHSEDLQDRVHEALVRKAEREPRFRERCAEAAARCLGLRRRCPPRPVSSPAAFAEIAGGPASRAVIEDIERARAARAAGAAT
ncbi:MULTISPECIES: beta-N-acetylhexosaminidase [Sorangium]|uniref:Put. Beta-glucosidase n=1 Tax=Sorangium cellulosum (strain So ce56) TaxID=448385 RepID=A9F261_SORC5|nr:beta-N-acetylhexosaminidase [Sorangium cellulosum]CAN94455.1 put. Beta-glucosidase [Sorangium cellulosum So ce56]